MNLPKESHGVLTITIRLAGEYLHISIEDNGIGREKAKLLKRKFSHKSLGMELSQQRVELMGSMPAVEKPNVRVIDLHDNSGRSTGTRVEVTIPVNY
ncbi:MAG: ATP-binding protein [Bacteroidia bacterium]